MATYEIPLTSEPEAFNLSLAGREVRLVVRWIEAREGGWMLDILEPDNAAPIVCGIPLVAGADLLEQYAYLEFGGELRLSGDEPATLDNLGTDVRLLFITPDEEDAA